MARKRAEQRSRAAERDSDGHGDMSERERQRWVNMQVREGVRAADSKANWANAKYENLWKNANLQNAKCAKAEAERDVAQYRLKFEREQDVIQRRALQQKIAELEAVIARLQGVVARHNQLFPIPPDPAGAAPPPPPSCATAPDMSPDDPRRPLAE